MHDERPPASIAKHHIGTLPSNGAGVEGIAVDEVFNDIVLPHPSPNFDASTRNDRGNEVQATQLDPARMTTWPLKEKKITVSTTLNRSRKWRWSMNRASRNPMLPGWTSHFGSINNTVPMVINPRKLMMKMTGVQSDSRQYPSTTQQFRQDNGGSSLV